MYKKIHETKDIKKMIEANIHLGNVILENSKFLNFKKLLILPRFGKIMMELKIILQIYMLFKK